MKTKVLIKCVKACYLLLSMMNSFYFNMQTKSRKIQFFLMENLSGLVYKLVETVKGSSQPGEGFTAIQNEFYQYSNSQGFVECMFEIAQETNDDAVAVFSFTQIKQFICSYWDDKDKFVDKERIRQGFLQILPQVRDKRIHNLIVFIITHIYKKDYPTNWPNFFDSFFELFGTAGENSDIDSLCKVVGCLVSILPDVNRKGSGVFSIIDSPDSVKKMYSGSVYEIFKMLALQFDSLYQNELYQELLGYLIDSLRLLSRIDYEIIEPLFLDMPEFLQIMDMMVKHSENVSISTREQIADLTFDLLAIHDYYMLKEANYSKKREECGVLTMQEGMSEEEYLIQKQAEFNEMFSTLVMYLRTFCNIFINADSNLFCKGIKVLNQISKHDSLFESYYTDELLIDICRLLITPSILLSDETKAEIEENPVLYFRSCIDDPRGHNSKRQNALSYLQSLMKKGAYTESVVMNYYMQYTAIDSNSDPDDLDAAIVIMGIFFPDERDYFRIKSVRDLPGGVNFNNVLNTLIIPSIQNATAGNFMLMMDIIKFYFDFSSVIPNEFHMEALPMFFSVLGKDVEPIVKMYATYAIRTILNIKEINSSFNQNNVASFNLYDLVKAIFDTSQCNDERCEYSSSCITTIITYIAPFCSPESATHVLQFLLEKIVMLFKEIVKFPTFYHNIFESIALIMDICVLIPVQAIIDISLPHIEKIITESELQPYVFQMFMVLIRRAENSKDINSIERLHNICGPMLFAQETLALKGNVPAVCVLSGQYCFTSLASFIVENADFIINALIPLTLSDYYFCEYGFELLNYILQNPQLYSTFCPYIFDKIIEMDRKDNKPGNFLVNFYNFFISTFINIQDPSAVAQLILQENVPNFFKIYNDFVFQHAKTCDRHDLIRFCFVFRKIVTSMELPIDIYKHYIIGSYKFYRDFRFVPNDDVTDREYDTRFYRIKSVALPFLVSDPCDVQELISMDCHAYITNVFDHIKATNSDMWNHINEEARNEYKVFLPDTS